MYRGRWEARQSRGLLEKRNHLVCLGECGSQRVGDRGWGGREASPGGSHCRVWTFPPKARKGHGQLLEATLAPHRAGLEGQSGDGGSFGRCLT